MAFFCAKATLDAFCVGISGELGYNFCHSEQQEGERKALLTLCPVQEESQKS